MFTGYGQPKVKKGISMNEKEQIILEAMTKASNPVRPGDVAKMTGLESKEVSKILSNLKKQGKIISPKRCFYAPR